jgi:hypothetical protein
LNARLFVDPKIPACPAGESRSVFGRMIFFEGSWDKLYERAQQERADLSKRSSSK